MTLREDQQSPTLVGQPAPAPGLSVLGYFLLALASHVLLLLRPADVSLFVSVQVTLRSAIVDSLRIAIVDGVLWCYLGSRLVRAHLSLLHSVLLVGRAYLPVGIGGALLSILLISFAAPSDSDALFNISTGLYVVLPAMGFLTALLRLRTALSLGATRVLLLLSWLVAVRLFAYAYVPNATALFYNHVVRSHRSVFSN